ncbi:hypothetical protein ACFX13_023038 [Malus domestica]
MEDDAVNPDDTGPSQPSPSNFLKPQLILLPKLESEKGKTQQYLKEDIHGNGIVLASCAIMKAWTKSSPGRSTKEEPWNQVTKMRAWLTILTLQRSGSDKTQKLKTLRRKISWEDHQLIIILQEGSRAVEQNRRKKMGRAIYPFSASQIHNIFNF